MIFIKRGNEVKGGTDIVYYDNKPHLFNSYREDEEEKTEITEITPDWEVYTMS